MALLARILEPATENPISVAGHLLDEFGTLGGVLVHADTHRGQRHANSDAVARLVGIRQTMERVLTEQVEARPILSSHEQLSDYLRLKLAFELVEQVRVLFLNVRNFLIADELHMKGDIDSAQVNVRQVITRALEHRAAAIILVHNHPSGDPTPSGADIDITRAVIDAGKRLGIAVHDHIVVGSRGQVSMRARGLI